MLCTVLSCHIGHGMTRTNQKCNSHLQSMSHVTWIKLNAFIFEALRIKTVCSCAISRSAFAHAQIGTVYFTDQTGSWILHRKMCDARQKTAQPQLFCLQFCICFAWFFSSGVSMFATYFLCSSMFICGAEGRCSTKVFCIPNLV